MDSPSPPHSTLLDALAFDLTIADSKESESGGGELEVPELPAIAQSRSPVQELGQVDSQCWRVMKKKMIPFLTLRQ